MAALANGHANGLNGIQNKASKGRFAHLPSILELPIYGEEEEAVEMNLTDLSEDPTELCSLLESEGLGKQFWLDVALAYAKQGKYTTAAEVLNRGQNSYQQGKGEDKLALLSALTWMYLQLARAAPHRTEDTAMAAQLLQRDLQMDDSPRSEHYLQLATETINEATRISPSYPPLLLARGVLMLLRAHRTSGRSLHTEERNEVLRTALKQFDDALKASAGKSVLAFVGKARVLFLLGKYSDAYGMYQNILQRAPDLDDPDPRIGIGCCLWQLGHREDARIAWERALELKPDSVVAIQLVGLYWLHISSQHAVTDAAFLEPYRKAISDYTVAAMKIDRSYPLTLANMASYVLSTKGYAKVQALALHALERAEVDAIASDAFYALARDSHQHQGSELSVAASFYASADELRGGNDGGYLPAKFGTAQLKILGGDLEGAKHDLELQVQKSKSYEAMVLLGLLYAEEVSSAEGSKPGEDKSKEHKKALQYLELVRLAWKDPKKKATPDIAVLLNLARLYEQDSPEKALQCLQQVEEMELDNLKKNDELKPAGVEDESVIRNTLREHLWPQLLNNLGCFYYNGDTQEKYQQARELFQLALSATMRIAEDDPSNDADALVTTISYNLGRTYEALNEEGDAKKVYRGLLARHPEYTDANARLAYINYSQASQSDDIPEQETIDAVFEKNKDNLEVRALQGLYYHRTKKFTMHISDDPEQRLFKRTLQEFNKHDVYSLVAMGNINLAVAREMKKESHEEKARRNAQYTKALEFFDKALQLDPKCANAAMGIGIVFAESRKDYPTAIQIFTQVKETIKDYTVYMNLGHVFYESGQFARSVENYEQALKKVDDRHRLNILMALGRVWLMRGKKEKSISAMKEALVYSEQAYGIDPHAVHPRFNVALVQYQIAQLSFTLPMEQRSLGELKRAANGLDDAIEAFRIIAKAPNPPYPPQDIEQRANMGANTMKKQLDRAIEEQARYEESNRERLERAREAREAEIRRREEEKQLLEKRMEEQKKAMQKEREAVIERDRKLAEARAEEERRREEEMMTTDTETGEKKKREKRKRADPSKKKKSKKDAVETDGDVGTGVDDDEAGERPRKKPKRRLERRSTQSQSKYKSSEYIEDSDDEFAEVPAAKATTSGTEASVKSTPAAVAATPPGADEEDVDEPIVKPRPRKAVRVVDDDEDEDVDVTMVNAVRSDNAE